MFATLVPSMTMLELEAEDIVEQGTE